MKISRNYIDLTQLTKVKSTAAEVLKFFVLQPALLEISDEAQLLNKHAYHMTMHYSPWAVLKRIEPSGQTVWEDGVDSFVELNEEMENVS